MPPLLAPAHNELPAKITVTGAVEEGIARVINEPDVLAVAGSAVGLAPGPDRLAQGCWPGLLCLGQRGGGLLMISLLAIVINTQGICDFS